MSIEKNVDLLKRIEERFSNVLTVHDMTIAMEIVFDEIYNETDCEDTIGLDMLEAFLSAKAIEGRSDKTLIRYRYVLNRALTEMHITERRITVYHLRSWLMKERDRGVSDCTLEGYREIFSSYFNWLQREALITNNPCVNLGAIRCAKVVRLPFTDVEIERMKEACDNIRDKALICFLLSTGCRISEVVALNREDINMQNLVCKVHGKGNKERVVYIDNITRMNLKRYEKSRTDLYPALFIGRGTERMHPGGIRRMLKHIEQKSGVENVHPHRFRRTLATNLINRGMPIQEVARVLGHDKLDTTMEYIYIDDKDVQVSYRKYS